VRAANLRNKLLGWYDSNRRDLPWRRSRDPYRILVSEVMLQQTRVETVLPYYERFLRLFPSAESLAAARPRKVLAAWAGLGYYRRARALHAAARAIRAAGFPSTYDGLLELPGVGPYTAAAVASIAFGRPHAVFDGNVRRVISRLFAARDGFRARTQTLLDPARPGDFNQAMMELGAVVCLPRQPRCEACPLRRHCAASRDGRIEQFPAPKAKAASQCIELRLAVVERDGKVLMTPPDAGGDSLWPGFWTLPQLPVAGIAPAEPLGRFRHTVTFRRITVAAFRARLAPQAGKRLAARGFRFVSAAQMAGLPVSTPTRKALALVARRCFLPRHS